jgi:hypothetical protein
MHSATIPAIQGFVGQGCRCATSFFLALSCRSNRSTAANDKTNTDCNNDRTGYNTNNSRIKRTNDSETITITPTGMCNNNNKDRDKGNGGCPNYGDNVATAHNNDRNMHNDNNNSGGEQNEGNTDGGCEDGSPGAPPHLFISFLMLIASRIGIRGCRRRSLPFLVNMAR